jgi:hypothetical protein
VTIAACYVTPEGVVLGADSTASAMLPGGFHYFNYNQKVFEVGDPGKGTLGITTWGLATVGAQSHRTLLALFHDGFKNKRPKTVQDAATQWIDTVWPVYSPLTKRCTDLNAKLPFDPIAASPNPAARTKTEEDEFKQLRRGLVLGFYIGGYLLPARLPEAFSISFDPLLGKPSPVPIVGGGSFAGASNMIKRLIFGCDDDFKADILKSGKWSGTDKDLDALLLKYKLSASFLPIRDVVDYVHSCIASTIKALKFSNLPQICGGPIEIAVITTDRPFRWVRHKSWDAAINEGL